MLVVERLHGALPLPLLPLLPLLLLLPLPQLQLLLLPLPLVVLKRRTNSIEGTTAGTRMDSRLRLKYEVLVNKNKGLLNRSGGSVWLISLCSEGQFSCLVFGIFDFLEDGFDY